MSLAQVHPKSIVVGILLMFVRKHHLFETPKIGLAKQTHNQLNFASRRMSMCIYPLICDYCARIHTVSMRMYLQCLSMRTYVCLFVCLSVYLSIYISMYTYVPNNPHAYLSIR